MTYTNVGHQDYEHTATLKMLPFEVFFNGKSLTKILSFDAVTPTLRISLET